MTPPTAPDSRLGRAQLALRSAVDAWADGERGGPGEADPELVAGVRAAIAAHWPAAARTVLECLSRDDRCTWPTAVWDLAFARETLLTAKVPAAAMAERTTMVGYLARLEGNMAVAARQAGADTGGVLPESTEIPGLRSTGRDLIEGRLSGSSHGWPTAARAVVGAALEYADHPIEMATPELLEGVRRLMAEGLAVNAPQRMLDAGAAAEAVLTLAGAVEVEPGDLAVAVAGVHDLNAAAQRFAKAANELSTMASGGQTPAQALALRVLSDVRRLMAEAS